MDPSKGSNGSKVLKALDIYENIKKTEILPSMSFHHLMNVCAKFGQGTAAVGMMADYKALKYEITPGLLGDFIITMSKHLRRINTSARSSAAIESDLKQAYQQYLSMLSNKHKGSVEIHDSSNNAPIGVHNSKNTFMQLATAYRCVNTMREC